MSIGVNTLNKEQRMIYEQMESSDENMFITGKAGTGKSYLLKCFLDNTKKNVVVIAPTGIAALNVRGATIHRFFGLKPELQVPEKIDGGVIYGNKRDLFRNLDTIVIDEISMVRADLMDTIDYILRKANSTNIPFGGKQMILFGDLFQLPPVVKSGTDEEKYLLDRYGGFFFFDAPGIKQNELERYELNEILRQSDRSLIDVLNHVRKGEQTPADLTKLNSRVSRSLPRTYKDDFITLTTTNENAQRVNSNMLAQIRMPEHNYWAYIEGEFKISDYPTDRKLTLKEGAHVMMLNNDMNRRWVNGSLATVVSCDKNTIGVKIDGVGLTYTVYKNKWEQIDYFYNKEKKKIESRVVGEFNQLPVKMAWAITIHKSQGKTYDKVEVDLGNGAFAFGQTYVAISRIRSLDGLHLKRPIRNSDIKVDETVKEYMQEGVIANFSEVEYA